MERQPVTSTDIRSIGYDGESLTLEIEFHSGGIYQYFDVPETVHRDLISASSHGGYFHRHIRDQYGWRKVR